METIQTGSKQVRFQEMLKELSSYQLPDIEQFVKQVLQLIEKRKSPNFIKKEKELIDKIKNGGPSEEFWKKYDVLAAKLENETMTDEENQAFEKLIAITGKWTYDRLKLMTELSELWNTSLEDILKRLDIKPRERVYA
jgi:hypothetical protein